MEAEEQVEHGYFLVASFDMYGADLEEAHDIKSED